MIPDPLYDTPFVPRPRKHFARAVILRFEAQIVHKAAHSPHDLTQEDLGVLQLLADRFISALNDDDD